MEYSETFVESKKRSDALAKAIDENPKAFRILTGDRPTGSLHIGHYFGSLKTRVDLMKKGVPLYILIADYQVLTDHDSYDKIAENSRELVLDYLSLGLNPLEQDVCIFPHSQIPELNQLLVPFLTLVSHSELERNPTVKEEIQASKMSSVNVGMFVYPVHQACDILSMQGTVVPVGKDQLPHVEMTRNIARRFNNMFKVQLFKEPTALLAETPMIQGLDGIQKMSKSRNNAIMLKMTRDEIAKAVKKAQTDCERLITYEPERRPHVANLLNLISLMGNVTPEEAAKQIGDNGAKALKEMLLETTDAFLDPIRTRRQQIADDKGYTKKVVTYSVEKARAVASDTLEKTRKAMNMSIL